MAHIRIVIDIPDDKCFDWEHATYLWRQFMPEAERGMNAIGRCVYTWNKTVIDPCREPISEAHICKEVCPELDRTMRRVDTLENHDRQHIANMAAIKKSLSGLFDMLKICH